MLNGLDLFSGIAGISLALAPWVRPLAYCENDRYAQSVLLSRMAERQIFLAPIWDDIRTLRGEQYKGIIDIIYGGFPCQDISIAGIGKGLEGERSGLFFEIIRLAKEIKPSFIFLENVPAITTRGGLSIVKAITEIGYDCRWCTLSAAEVGANHRRERWWLLAHTNGIGGRSDTRGYGLPKKSKKLQQENGQACADNLETVGANVANYEKEDDERIVRSCRNFSNTDCIGCSTGSNNRKERYIQSSFVGQSQEVQQEWNERIVGTGKTCSILPDTDCKECTGLPYRENEEISFIGSTGKHIFESEWWSVEPNVGRVVTRLSNRVDRIKCLGNAVVPHQAREAFKELMGIKE